MVVNNIECRTSSAFYIWLSELVTPVFDNEIRKSDPVHFWTHLI